MRIFWHFSIVILLTLLTQIGGVIWLGTRALPRHRFVGFIAIYTVASIALTFAAPIWGRERLPTYSTRLAPKSWIYPALNRNFVSPTMLGVASRLSYEEKVTLYQSTPLEYLDGGFPFGGIPLLPHLSHKDGRKLDFALPYQEGASRSPIGYFAFEYPTQETCPQTFPTLRWDLKWLQPLWPQAEVDWPRLKKQINILIHEPMVEKIFLEPHIVANLGIQHDKIRFQGCRAARHDDHIHVQVH